jgi:hypothetical protein
MDDHHSDPLRQSQTDASVLGRYHVHGDRGDDCVVNVCVVDHKH